MEKPLREQNNMYLSYFAQSLAKSLLCQITKLQQIIYLEAKIKIIISKQHKNLNCLLTLCDQNGFCILQPTGGDVIYQCQNFILNTCVRNTQAIHMKFFFVINRLLKQKEKECFTDAMVYSIQNENFRKQITIHEKVFD